MFAGEWRTYARAPDAAEAAWEVVHLFERPLYSEINWKYEAGIDTLGHSPALWPPYRERVAGRLLSYGHDGKRRRLKFVWQEERGLDSRTPVYVPGWLKRNAPVVEVGPSGGGYEWVSIGEEGTGYRLAVPATGRAPVRTLTVAAPTRSEKGEGR